MSAPSLAKFIMKRPWLERWVEPVANWYCNAAGYRKLGLKWVAPGSGLCTKNQTTYRDWELKNVMLINHGDRADDLIPEESDTVLLALKRLPPKEAYDRVFRLRRAFQVWSLDRAIGNKNRLLTRDSAPFLISYFPKTNKQSPKRRVPVYIPPRAFYWWWPAYAGLWISIANHTRNWSRGEGARGFGSSGHKKEII